MTRPSFEVERWTLTSRVSMIAAALILLTLALGPLLFSDNAIDRLTTLFVYVILAVMWNALAGYAGLVSIGQQVFFGLGAYFAVRMAHAGVPVYLSLGLAGAATGLFAWPLSYFILRLREGEFAIGMWVVAELCHLLVNLDSVIQGETGTSLIALNAYDANARHAYTYWTALGCMTLLLSLLFALLRSRTGAGIQAIRDNEEAASSVGVEVARTKRLIFILAGLGAGLAGSLWLANAITFQPKTYFSPQWTAYMIFMALVGGLGSFEGAILGAVIFFAIEAVFGSAGVWYLIGLGATALAFALFLPRGLWGWVEARFGLSLLPVGYRLRLLDPGMRRTSSDPTAASLPLD
jgi:branched-chain amino acid transport system permease protein